MRYRAVFRAAALPCFRALSALLSALPRFPRGFPRFRFPLFALVQWKSNGFGTFRGPRMDPFLDPKIDPKSNNFGISKRYLKITFLDIEMNPKWGEKK